MSIFFFFFFKSKHLVYVNGGEVLRNLTGVTLACDFTRDSLFDDKHHRRRQSWGPETFSSLSGYSRLTGSLFLWLLSNPLVASSASSNLEMQG